MYIQYIYTGYLAINIYLFVFKCNVFQLLYGRMCVYIGTRMYLEQPLSLATHALRLRHSEILTARVISLGFHMSTAFLSAWSN